MARMFGTDGVRGVANEELTGELAYRIGRAGANVLTNGAHKPTILVGRDPRISGNMLEAAVVAGICSTGATAALVGVLPTPAVAHLTRLYEMDAGVMISASHNSVEYNGIKFFDGNGFKLPDALEDQIEALVKGEDDLPRPVGVHVGRSIIMRNATDNYMEFVKATTQADLTGMTIVVDAANGAASYVAPRTLADMGATVHAFYNEPDGTNINDLCGSTHPERLQQLVQELGADIGLAFDGDADRLIAVDDLGRLVDGDHVMAICALDLKERGALKGNTLVGTVMSNMGLEIAMKQAGIQFIRTQVGDRYVLERMCQDHYCLGGEASGHVIFLDHNSTGDGLLTAVQLISVMVRKQKRLSILADQCMEELPQVLVNIRINTDRREFLQTDVDIRREIDRLEKNLEGKGRVLIRLSGTEPLVRVMVEGEDHGDIQHKANELAELIQKKMS